jgi:hypothetical protein
MKKSDAVNPKESFRVTFVIQGLNLDFEAITRGLRVPPSYTHRAGDIGKTKIPFPHDMWALTSSADPTDEPFDAHVKWLIKKLKGIVRLTVE